jgi:hypothetical protein
MHPRIDAAATGARLLQFLECHNRTVVKVGMFYRPPGGGLCRIIFLNRAHTAHA